MRVGEDLDLDVTWPEDRLFENQIAIAEGVLRL